MSEPTTLHLYDAGGEPVDEISTALPSEINQLRSRGYCTQEEYSAAQAALKAHDEAKAKEAAEADAERQKADAALTAEQEASPKQGEAKSTKSSSSAKG